MSLSHVFVFLFLFVRAHIHIYIYRHMLYTLYTDKTRSWIRPIQMGQFSQAVSQCFILTSGVSELGLEREQVGEGLA